MTDSQPLPSDSPRVTHTDAYDASESGGRPPDTPRTVTIKHLVVLEALAKRRWDIAIVVALGEGPTRFVDLRKATASWMGQPCHPYELSRCSKVLLRGGYITGPEQPSNEARYALTDRGRSRLAVITALSGTIDQQPASHLANL